MMDYQGFARDVQQSRTFLTFYIVLKSVDILTYIGTFLGVPTV